MAVNKYPIIEYSPKKSDVFLFDTNVWINIYGAIGNYNRQKQKVFSRFLKEVKTAGATIVINSMILSEFTNRFIRFNFEQWKNSSGNFGAKYKKDYVGSEEYKEAAKEAVIYLKKILSISLRMTDDFNAINIENVSERLNHIDFNDSYIIELADLKDYKIVTDDKDFVNHDIHSSTVIYS